LFSRYVHYCRGDRSGRNARICLQIDMLERRLARSESGDEDAFDADGALQALMDEAGAGN